ncbi:MAG: general secretion pathway protein C, partial [Kiritimatiellia bacterium]
TAPSSPGMDRRQYVDGIMRRNIFDHNNVDKQDSKPACEGPDCAQGEKSDLPVMLIATLVKQPALYSTAYIMDENSKESKVYRVDSMLLDARIERIYTRRIIVVRGDGTREYITMGEDDKPESGDDPAASSSGGGDVEKVGEEEYNISSELIDNALKNIDQLAKMARARPHKDESGNIDGYRLSGVRRGKLPYKLGIKNGDIVHSVNGIPLSSTQQALNAWQSLQNEANFSFDITRRGQKKTMKYHVR